MVAGRPPPSFCHGPMPYDCGSNGHPAKREGYFPSFVNNLVTPFMSCWQPPINACVSPTRRPNADSLPVVSPQQSKSQPATNIREPHSNDVLCGRGGSSNRHVGNLNFRSLVSANKDMYITLTKKQKMTVARKIVDAIHGQSPPGRFLQKDPVTGLWFDIGLPRSLEKTSQALREKVGQTQETPASPGGSSVTAESILSEEILSDSAVLPPSVSNKSPPSSPPPVSPLGTAASSPITSPTKVSPNDVPEICIPEHLEEQFRPQAKVMKHRPLPPPNRPEYYMPVYPHHHPYPPHGPPPPTHSYLHHHPPPRGHPVHDFYGRPPPPHYPYPPPMSMDTRRRPFPPPSFSAPQHVPPSPDRRDYHYHDPRQQQPPPPPPSQPHLKHSASSKQPQLPLNNHGKPVSDPESVVTSPDRKTSGSRQTTEVSPGRAQVWKKRRGVDEAVLLSQASQLSLSEAQKVVPDMKELASPSSILQSRSRRSINSSMKSVKTSPLSLKSTSSTASSSIIPSDDSSSVSQQLADASAAWCRSVNRGDALAGLAALSSAALLKLDAEGK